jgi:hypothetical protein
VKFSFIHLKQKTPLFVQSANAAYLMLLILKIKKNYIFIKYRQNIFCGSPLTKLIGDFKTCLILITGTPQPITNCNEAISKKAPLI